MQLFNGFFKKGLCPLIAASFLASSFFLAPESNAIVSSGHSKKSTRSHKKKSHRSYKRKSKYRTTKKSSRRYKSSKRSRRSRRSSKRKTRKKKSAPRPIPPQAYLQNLNKLTLKPGLVFRYFRGPLAINVVEVDLKRNNLAVRPYLASHNFDKLKTVQEHAQESGALVTVNANYFKKDGTPLGAIKMDGKWVSGSLFNRVAMGITKEKNVLFAPVNLHGILETSNPEAKSLWVNNMNQPRINGAKLILYTRRWGNSITLPYEGNLVAVNKKGEVTDVHSRAVRIPYEGFVLTDRKESKLQHLKKGDQVHLTWHTNPKHWNKVEHAISGGPTLIRDGRLYVGLKSERFSKSWTSSKITHRTACGFTRDRRLIIATVEGPHNMWDLAKFMYHLGCVDAMNLDGGGSTTMVVNGTTVTRNGNHSRSRKVAATLLVLDPTRASHLARNPDRGHRPNINLTTLISGLKLLDQLHPMDGIKEAKRQQEELDLLTGIKISNFTNLLNPQEIEASQDQKSTVVFKNPNSDETIDIDDDLVEDPEYAEDLRMEKYIKEQKKKLKEEKKRLRQKQAKNKKPWSKRVLNPFKS